MILNKLSTKLRKQIDNQISVKLIEKFPLLEKNFTQETMSQLIDHVEEIRASPNEIIIDE